MSLILVIPSLALNNNSNINSPILNNNTSVINPLAQSNENIDNNFVNLTEENSYLNSTNLTNSESGIVESIYEKISQLPIVSKIAIFLFIIGIIIARYIENKKLVQFYSVRKNSKNLKFDDLKITKYPEYIRKNSHDTIINKIKEGENKILLKGVTGLGKTRAVFEVIKEIGLKSNYLVIIPTQKINLPISVPRDCFILKRRFILFFDDIDKYVGNGTEIRGIINEFEKNSKNLIVLSTCREEEYDILQKERIHELFDIIEFDKLSTDDGIRLAKSVGKEFNPKEFDGTAGSIVLDEHRKKEYYNKFNSNEKNILRAIKLLSLSNIFSPSEQLLMKVYEIIFHPNDDFNTYFIDLKDKKFINSEKDNVSCPDYYLSKIIIDYPLGNQLFEHMLELRKVLFELRNFDNLFCLGNAFYFKEKFHDAITCFDKALEINPKLEIACNNKGLAFTDLGKYNEAITCFDKALEINPKMDAAWINKGNAMHNLGKYNEAIACYDKALETNPKMDDAWINKGNAMHNLGKYTEALTCFNKALEINPKQQRAWHKKGLALGKSGKYNEAITCFNKSLEINPNMEDDWINKGIALNYTSKYNEAITCFDKALELNPKKEEAWIAKGISLGLLSINNEAIACFNKSLELNPKKEEAWIKKGIVLKILGKYTEAITCFDKALAIDPKMESAWYYRACAYSMTGDKDKALSDLRRAIEFDTSNKEKAKKDKEFKIIWGDENFKKLVA
nr:MAG: tetratricopeptide repeat protein [Candidatus Methanoperedens sp.]